MQLIDWLIVGLYRVVTMGLGVYLSSKASGSLVKFFVAGRSLLIAVGSGYWLRQLNRQPLFPMSRALARKMANGYFISADLISCEGLATGIIMNFFRQYIAPLFIVLIFAVALLAVSARIFLPSDMMAPAPITEPVSIVPSTLPSEPAMTAPAVF